MLDIVFLSQQFLKQGVGGAVPGIVITLDQQGPDFFGTVGSAGFTGSRDLTRPFPGEPVGQQPDLGGFSATLTAFKRDEYPSHDGLFRPDHGGFMTKDQHLEKSPDLGVERQFLNRIGGHQREAFNAIADCQVDGTELLALGHRG